MFIKNKTTGLVWDVEGELLERLLASEEYEQVKEEKQQEPKKSPAKKG